MGAIITENRFVMVSELMTNGNISEFIVVHPDVNRFELVSSLLKYLISLAVDIRNSWQMLRKA